MQENGYSVQTGDVQNLPTVRARYNVPQELQACHTAIVDGYIIEGHVPVDEIERLLSERPDIVGLAVVGMPVGSPGMEIDEITQDPFDVIAFDESGSTEVFASYPK